jgi:hypothetical protein
LKGHKVFLVGWEARCIYDGFVLMAAGASSQKSPLQDMLRMVLIAFSLLALGCAYFACGLVLGKQATAVVGNGSTTSAALCSGGPSERAF